MTECLGGIVLSLVIILWTLPGAAEELAPDEQDVIISVSKGDTLTSICKTYLADYNDCQSIAQLNQVPDPNFIQPNQNLIIPAALLKRIPQDGVVTFLTGNVQSRVQRSTPWKTLQLNDRVKQGLRIQTGDKSTVELMFENGTTLLIKANTVIDVVQSQKLGPLPMIQEFFLTIGNILTTIKRATGGESRLKIHTPSGITAARGTQFRAGVDLAAKTRTETLEGSTDVSALSQTVPVRQGQGTVIEFGKPPLPPRPLLPPPAPIQVQPVYRQLPVQLRFEPVTGAHAYRLMLTRDRDGKQVIQEVVLSPSEILDLSDIDDGDWFLHTLSIDELQLQGLPSEPIALTLKMRHPLPPELQTPVEASIYAVTSIPLTWHQALEAVRYQLQLAEDRAFTTLVEDRADIEGLSITTQPLEANTYYVRLRSIAADEYPGPWTDPVQVTIAPRPDPTLTEVEGDSSRLDIRWPQVGANLSYRLQLSNDANFSDLILDQTLSTPDATIAKPASAGTYFVRVSALDAQGNQGEFSTPLAFDVKGRPYIVILLALIIITGMMLGLIKRFRSRGTAR